MNISELPPSIRCEDELIVAIKRCMLENSVDVANARINEVILVDGRSPKIGGTWISEEIRINYLKHILSGGINIGS